MNNRPMKGIVITEWATWVTDFILFLQCFYSGRMLARSSRRGLSAWAIVFYLSSVAAFLGAIQHGFSANFGPDFSRGLGQWIIGLLSLASLTLGWIFSQSFLASGPFQFIFRVFLLSKMVLFAYEAVIEPRFLMAVIDYASALLLLLLAYGLSLRERPGAPNFVKAILIAFGGAAIQALKIAPAASFDHNALFHVIQMVSFYYFLQAAKQEFFPLNRTLSFQKA
jgi:hypothetical protein